MKHISITQLIITFVIYRFPINLHIPIKSFFSIFLKSSLTEAIILGAIFSIREVRLSLGTTFLFVKMIHRDIVLLSITQWSWHNLFYGYNFWGLSIIAFVISLLMFYWIIPILILQNLTNKIGIKYGLFLKQTVKLL